MLFQIAPEVHLRVHFCFSVPSSVYLDGNVSSSFSQIISWPYSS